MCDWGIRKKTRRKIRIGLAAFVLALAFLNPEIIRGVFDEGQAVHINPDEIENSTLIIGTHLVYLYSLNDDIYELASKSASQWGQSKIYYKSELSGGAWFDITEANSLKEITDQGEKADKKEIENLFFTHHTKSDGKTYDLRTNTQVSVFDISSPYHLEEMEELEALKLQYEEMKGQEGKSDTVKKNLNLVEYFYETETKTEDTGLYDMQMEALQKYYESLSGEELVYRDAVSHVMKKVDAARRLIAYQIAEEGLTVLMEDVNSTYPDNGETEEVEYSVDNALLTAIGDCQSALGESITVAEGNLLEEGTTAISKMEYELSLDLIRGAEGEDYDACGHASGQLLCLFHIIDGVIIDREEELSLLEKLKKQGESQGGEELSYILRQIEIRQEEDGKKDAGEKELEELYEKKEQLKEKRSKALDNLDIDRAKKLEAELIAVQEEIDKGNRVAEASLKSLMERQAELNRILKNNPGDEGARAELEGILDTISKSREQLAGEGQAKNIMDVKESLENALGSGDVSESRLASMEKDVDALALMLDSGSSLAMSALKEVYTEMAGAAYLLNTKAYDGLLERIEEEITESDVLTLSRKGGLTRELAQQALAEMEDNEGASEVLKTAQVMGLGEYAKETGNEEIAALAEGKAGLISGETGMVFENYEVMGEKFIPIDKLADFLGYRYVWNDTGKNGIISTGRTYYSFTAFCREVEKNGGKDVMGFAAELKGTIYIPASYANAVFGCEIQEVYGTEYCAFIEEETKEKAKEVLSLLQRKGGVEWE